MVDLNGEAGIDTGGLLRMAESVADGPGTPDPLVDVSVGVPMHPQGRRSRLDRFGSEASNRAACACRWSSGGRG